MIVEVKNNYSLLLAAEFRKGITHRHLSESRMRYKFPCDNPEAPPCPLHSCS